MFLKEISAQYEKKMYNGLIPFFLMGGGKKIYISPSNRNIEDYYFVVKDFFSGRTEKIENINISKEEIEGNKQRFNDILNSDNFIIFMSIGSSVDYYYRECKRFEIEKGKKYGIKEIITFLEENGYYRNYFTTKKGEYSTRGDILDIYSFDSDYPVRIEFFGNIVESIRNFDLDTQKSINRIDKITIIVNQDNEENRIYIDEIAEKYNIELYIENEETARYKLEEYIIDDRKSERFLRERYNKIYNRARKIEVEYFSNNNDYRDYEKVRKKAENKKIVILSEEDARYREIFSESSNIFFEKYPYFEGFELNDTIILTDRELKGLKIKRADRRKEGLKINSLSNLIKGDYVIHKNYGVGIFTGTEEINGKDYISIKYADNDKLYVPLENIGSIEKYIYDPLKTPEIYKLGTAGFKKKREKLREEIIAFAKELIEVQAKRNSAVGYKFSKDTVWQEEFEEAFPYNETEGQNKAIYDVKGDMESWRPMDRVICGDVGYGKTEVALRAAFKATIEGKQVAILAPTTVLVNQHYERIKDRFKNFPVNIDMMSRIETSKEQREIIRKLKDKRIDIVVGTHRLIQDDIEFGDLGLVIIDEEQKFGVKAKEKLKKIRNNVDILTLTATPIPRTLNMALLGIKDISIIETPPENRLPIETKFLKFEKDKLREAVLKEIARDGQVFYLYNSVMGMEHKLKTLREILPSSVKIDFVHGQMDPDEIKRKMKEFEERKYDVLITTTIIENGIDIENVNTMIIEDYDKLGLSQIYQLRGRIGRGNRKAFCYLLINNDRKITKKGKEKTEVIKEMKDLGVGFQLSLEDMRIRGTGEILGEKQHGVIEELGYDMYMKMLDEEMRNIKGEEIINKENIVVDLRIKGFIPEHYINETEKINIYKRLAKINKTEEIEYIRDEIKDRFGKIPSETETLLKIIELKIEGIKKNISEIKEEETGYLIKFNENKVEMEYINMLLSDNVVKYRQRDKALFLEKNRMDIFEFITFLNKNYETNKKKQESGK